MKTHDSNIIVLKGETIASIEGAQASSNIVIIKTESGRTFRMYHEQDCCESVAIESVAGDPASLIGRVVTEAIETREDTGAKHGDNSSTETTFVLTTDAGPVTILWVGTSNGYYGEDVSFVEDVA